MVAQTHGVVLTYEDLQQMPEDRQRYEIIEGVLHVTPAPNIGHQRAVGKLYRHIDEHVTDNELGEVLVAPCDVYLERTTVVQPDVVFVARTGRARILPGYIEGPPDLVIEVFSPSTMGRDLGTKLQVYAAHGIPHYWTVNIETREIVARGLESGEYRVAATGHGEERFSAPPFPDLAIPLAALWG